VQPHTSVFQFPVHCIPLARHALGQRRSASRWVPTPHPLTSSASAARDDPTTAHDAIIATANKIDLDIRLCSVTLRAILLASAKHRARLSAPRSAVRRLIGATSGTIVLAGFIFGGPREVFFSAVSFTETAITHNASRWNVIPHRWDRAQNKGRRCSEDWLRGSRRRGHQNTE